MRDFVHFIVGAVRACEHATVAFWYTTSVCIASEHRPNLYWLMSHICNCLLEATAAVRSKPVIFFPLSRT